MAQFKFLKGNYSGLNSVAITEGQLLITKDTRELFVDVDESTRIKIGDFTIVATLAELEALDPTVVPTSRLYYVEDSNIFCKSTGAAWTQINKDTGMVAVAFDGEGNAITDASYDSDTRTLTLTRGETFATKAEHDALVDKVGTVPEDQTVMGIITNIQENAYDDTELRDLINANTDAIAAAQKAADDAQDDIDAYIESNDAALGDIRTSINAAATKEYTDAELAKKVDTKVGYSLVSDDEIARLATLKNYDDTDLADRVTTAETQIGDLQTLAGTHATKDELKAVDDKFENYVTTESYDADKATMNKAIEDEAKARSDADQAFETRVVALEANFGDGEGTVDKKLEDIAKAEAEARAEAVKGVQDNVDALAGKVGDVPVDQTVVQMIAGNTTAIGAEKTRAEGVEAGFDTRIKAIEDDYLKAEDKEALQTQINTIVNNPDTEGVINSINEFTKYIADHGEIAEGFRTDIDTNKKAIDDEIARADAADKDIIGRLDILEAINHDAYIAADTAMKTEIDADVKAVGDALDQYKTENNAAVALKADASTVTAIDEAYKAADVALSSAIEAAKLEACNQDAAVLAEAQAYTDEQIAAMPTSWNDLTDKPFYDEGDTVVDVINFTSEEWLEGGVLELGRAYTVDWNGTLYENVIGAKYEDTSYYPSKLAVLLGGTDGYPFAILDYCIDENDPDYGVYIFSVDGSEYTVAVSTIKKNVHTLDPKFIPEEAQSDWNQNNIHDPSYIKNRPFYLIEKVTGDPVIDVTLNTAEMENVSNVGYQCVIPYGGDGANIIPERNPFSDMVVYDVIYNGTTYEVPYEQVYSSYGYLGSEQLTEYPFYIYMVYDGVQFTFNTAGIHTVKVLNVLAPETIKHIDEKFIPDVIARKSDLVKDWNESDSYSNAYIQNRTHYRLNDPYDNGWVFDSDISLTYQSNDYMYYYKVPDDQIFAIEDGHTYCMQWQNKVHELLVPYRTTMGPNGREVMCIGDESLVNKGQPYEYTHKYDGMNFAIFSYQTSNGKIVTEIRVAWRTEYSENQTPHVVVQTEDNAVYYPLYEKFIPDTIARKSDLGAVGDAVSELEEKVFTKEEVTALLEAQGSWGEF